MEHEQTPLAGIDWDSQRVQGPEDNPNHWSRRRSSDYQPYVGQQWRDYLATESQRIADKHGVTPAMRGLNDAGIHQTAEMANMLADPEHARVQHLTELLNDTHGNPFYGNSYDHAKNTPRYQPLSMMQSKRWTYDKYQAEEEQQGLDKINKIASRRGLPADYSINVDRPGTMPPEYSRNGDEYRIVLAHKGENVGSLSWHGDTGYVANLSIEAPHRNLLSQMLSKAHEVSHENGHTGPTASGELSAYSYKLMRKHAASFIPEDATVEQEDQYWYDDVAHAYKNAANTVKSHWETAKPEMVRAVGDDPDDTRRLSAHETSLNNLLSSANGGRLNEAVFHAGMLKHIHNRLVAKYQKTVHPRAHRALFAAAEPLRKLSNGDFSDEVYGH